MRREVAAPRGSRGGSRGSVSGTSGAGSSGSGSPNSGTPGSGPSGLGTPGSGASGGKAAAPAELSGEAAALFDRLRTWRGATAKEQGVPAYVIFHDAPLREIALARPHSLAELAGISGIGDRKLEAYGEAIITVVASTT